MKWGSWIFCISSTRNLNCEILKEQRVLQQGTNRLSSRMRAILFSYSCIPPLYAGRTIFCSSSAPYATNPEGLRHSFFHSFTLFLIISLLHSPILGQTFYYISDSCRSFSYQWGRHFFASQNQYMFTPIFIFLLFSSAIYSNFASCLGFYFYYETSLFL